MKTSGNILLEHALEIKSLQQQLAEARNKALEEAAQLAYHYAYGIVLTDAIRALKTISGEAA